MWKRNCALPLVVCKQKQVIIISTGGRNELRGHIHASFIHLVVCLTTGPKVLPKWALHIVRSRASSFKWEYTLLSLKSSSSFLRLLPRLPVTSILPFIFPSITRCRSQFLRKMWPNQLAFILLISCRIFLCSLTLSNTSLSQANQLNVLEDIKWKWTRIFTTRNVLQYAP